MEEGINSMIMKPIEDTKLQCAPVEIIKMDTDRFEIKAANKKTRQLRKNENSCQNIWQKYFEIQIFRTREKT